MSTNSTFLGNTARFITRHKLLILSFVFFFFFSLGITVFAVPPTTPYTPGETLSPSCAPSSTNCIVGILESQNNTSNLTYNTKVLNFGSGLTATESSGTVTVTASGGASTLAEVASASTTSAHQTFAIDSGTAFSIEGTSGAGAVPWVNIDNDSGYMNVLGSTVDIQGTTSVVLTSGGNGIFVEGNFIFNDGGSNTQDFRAESNNNAHMFFIDASADAIGIGDSTPTHTLDIAGKIGINDTQVVYLPNQASFIDTLILGDGGGSLVPDGDPPVYNTFVGIGVAQSLVAPSMSTIIGSNAAFSATSAARSTIIGSDAAYSVTSAGWNVVIGDKAAYSNTSNWENVIIGSEALYSDTTAFQNVVLGVRAGYDITTGQQDVIIGAYTMSGVTGSSSNVVIGDQAGSPSVGNSYSNSVIVGAEAGTAGGDESVAIGYLASAGGNKNVSIGTSALNLANASAVNNIAIGWGAGDTITTGTDNILLGYNTEPTGSGASNELNIGNTIYGDLSSDKVGIGSSTLTNTPTGGLRATGGFVVGADSTNNLIDDASNGAGSTTLYIGNSTIDVTPSDERLKDNITDSELDALELINELRIVDFDWKNPNQTHTQDRVYGGLIAQELDEIYPQAVIKGNDPDSMWGLRSGLLIPIAFKAIQEMDVELQGLTALDIEDSTLWQRVKTFLAQAVVNIQEVIASRMRTDVLCVGDTCVTEIEFLQMVESSNSVPISVDNSGSAENQEVEEDVVETEDTSTSEQQEDEVDIQEESENITENQEEESQTQESKEDPETTEEGTDGYEEEKELESQESEEETGDQEIEEESTLPEEATSSQENSAEKTE